jgi:prepilin-type processing-associated H-X9-DG protein
MKLYFSNQRQSALTIWEVLVVIALLLLLVILFFPHRADRKSRAPRIECVSNLKQVNLSLRVWESDNNNQYPMAISMTNGGAMELAAAGNVAGIFQVMSNELITPKILVCPADKEHIPAMDFGNSFNNSYLSYFINPDANAVYPQMIMTGDDNFATNGVSLKPGVVELSSQFLWTNQRHINVGNIGYADGSVAEVSDNGLEQAIVLSTNGTDVLINRIAIP